MVLGAAATTVAASSTGGGLPPPPPRPPVTGSSAAKVDASSSSEDSDVVSRGSLDASKFVPGNDLENSQKTGNTEDEPSPTDNDKETSSLKNESEFQDTAQSDNIRNPLDSVIRPPPPPTQHFSNRMSEQQKDAQENDSSSTTSIGDLVRASLDASNMARSPEAPLDATRDTLRGFSSGLGTGTSSSSSKKEDPPSQTENQSWNQVPAPPSTSTTASNDSVQTSVLSEDEKVGGENQSLDGPEEKPHFERFEEWEKLREERLQKQASMQQQVKPDPPGRPTQSAQWQQQQQPPGYQSTIPPMQPLPGVKPQQAGLPPRQGMVPGLMTTPKPIANPPPPLQQNQQPQQANQSPANTALGGPQFKTQQFHPQHGQHVPQRMGPASFGGPPVSNQQPWPQGQRPPYQQQRPPYPNQPQPRQRPIQHQRTQRPKDTPAWKRIWKKIEGGLDSLADLEEKVAGTASHLYTATVETASTVIKTKPLQGVGPKTNQPPSNYRPPRPTMNDQEDESDFEPEGTAPMVNNPQQQQHRVSPNRQASPSQPGVDPAPINPYTVMMQKGSQNPTTLVQAGNQGGIPPRKVERINWSDAVSGKTNRPILANGGASSLPPGDGPNQSMTSSDLPGGYRPTSQAPTFPQTSGVSTPTAPQQRRDVSSILQDDPTKGTPPEKPVGRVAHGPQRPSPTASAQGSQRPAPIRKRVPYGDNDDEKGFGPFRFIPKVPSFNLLRFRQGSYGDYSATMDAWSAEDSERKSSGGGLFGLWKKKKPSEPTLMRSGTRIVEESPALTGTVRSLMGRCSKENGNTLLKGFERQRCISLGRQKAFFDLAGLFFVLYAAREFIQVDPIALGRSTGQLADAAISIISELKDGWFMYAAVAAFLSWSTNAHLYEKAASGLASSIGNKALQEAQYGALFLRLVSSESTKKSAVEDVRTTSKAQALGTVESARLRTFTTVLLLSLLVMTLSFIQPLLLAAGSSLVEMVSIAEWRNWPPEWHVLWSSIQHILVQFFHFVKSAVSLEIKSLSQQPLRFAYDASLFLALLTVTQLPKMEIDRKVKAPSEDDENEDVNNSMDASLKIADTISNLGRSSATRLQLISKKSALDEFLEMWRTSIPSSLVGQGMTSSIGDLLYFVSYGIISGVLLMIPLVVYGRAGVIGDLSPNGFHLLRWDCLWEVAIVLIYTQMIFITAISRAIDASSAKRKIVRFLSDFVGSVNERTKLLKSPPANLQVLASISSTAGIGVHDLWAAHSVRRAWGVRGANFLCRNGEVLVVLGEDGAGRSRLLTTLAESILVPPKRAQTSTKVRGAVSIGGVDVGKWDPNQLRKRVGIMLHDVRTTSDLAQALSGLTLEEILDPNDGLKNLETSQNLASGARASMVVALKITGLYSSLLPRLSSKLSTVVTGNEDDLSPSPLRPLYNILSPTEWTKLIMARVLCHAIYNNETSGSAPDKVEKSLIGCVLLLDDVTASLSEIDEGRFVKDLRSSGAATVLSSNRWAVGRWADRIVVLRDGAVVETGTHDELMGRGPQLSLYAAKWHEMTK